VGFRSFSLKGLATLCVVTPAIGIGYYAADPENALFATQAEAHIKEFSSSSHVRQSSRSLVAMTIPVDARYLFARSGKGPRADKYGATAQTSLVIKRPVQVASLNHDGDITGALPRNELSQVEINRSVKADRVFTPLVKLAETPPNILDDRPSAALFLASVFSTSSYAFPVSKPEVAVSKKPELGKKLHRGITYKGETEMEYQTRQRRCLATAIYFEARGEPVKGQLAVAQVVMNRVRSSIYPDTICGVVFQGQLRRKGCQFSFTCDGHTDVPKDKERWLLANKLAAQVTRGEVWLPEIGRASHYHATYVKPRWRRDMNKVKKVGRHIFYKIRQAQINDVLSGEKNQAQGLALVKSE